MRGSSKLKPLVPQGSTGAEEDVAQAVHAGISDIQTRAGDLERIVLAAIRAVDGLCDIPGDPFKVAVADDVELQPPAGAELVLVAEEDVDRRALWHQFTELFNGVIAFKFSVHDMFARSRVVGFRHLAGYLHLPDLPARQHAQAKARRALARWAVVEARSALPCRAW